LTTGGSARVVRATVVYALGAPLLTQEERKGLRVLCDIGCYSVIADAVVGEDVGIASVGVGSEGGRAGGDTDELDGISVEQVEDARRSIQLTGHCAVCWLHQICLVVFETEVGLM
jgi:hypothetical protein